MSKPVNKGDLCVLLTTVTGLTHKFHVDEVAKVHTVLESGNYVIESMDGYHQVYVGDFEIGPLHRGEGSPYTKSID